MFKKNQEPIASVLFELIKKLNLKVTYSSIENIVLQQPEFPYITAITNTLKYFGINNKVVKVEKETLDSLELPCLALTSFDETYMITNVNDRLIEYYSPSKGWVKAKKEDFYKKWNNFLILVDTDAVVEEDKFKSIFRIELLNKLKIIALFLITFLLLLFVFLYLDSSLFKIYFSVKIIGFLTTLLLVKKLIFNKTNYDFCSIGKKINCNDVLNSPAAKIFSWLTLTDIGFLYFLGSILSISFSLIITPFGTTEIHIYLFILSFFSIPYTLFSIYYQGIILRKWCVLCILIIVLIWLEAFIGFLYYSINSYNIDFQAKSIFIFSFSFSIPILIWFTIRKNLLQIGYYKNLKYSHARLLNNITIFKSLQNNEKNIFLDINETEIVIGNINAENTMLMVINPYCSACGREFDDILSLLEKHPDYTKIIVRFIGGNDDTKFFTSLMLIGQYLNNPVNFTQILKEWFIIKDVKQFILKYPISHNKLSESILKKHYIWSAQSKIEITPTIFFNNQKLNPNYNVLKITQMLSINNNL